MVHAPLWFLAGPDQAARLAIQGVAPWPPFHVLPTCHTRGRAAATLVSVGVGNSAAERPACNKPSGRVPLFSPRGLVGLVARYTLLTSAACALRTPGRGVGVHVTLLLISEYGAPEDT